MIDKTTELSKGCRNCGPNWLEFKLNGLNLVCVRCSEIHVPNFLTILNS